MKDIITSSCIAGSIAFLYKTIVNHILYHLGLTPFLYRVEAATLMVSWDVAHTLYGAIIGLFADLVLVVWFALLIAYILRVTGFDYAILKGAFVGASSWLIIYGFFTHLETLALYPPHGLVSGLTSIFFDVTVGMISAYVLVYLSNRIKV